MLESTTRRLEAIAARTQTQRRLPSAVFGVIRDGRLAWCSGRGVHIAPDVRRRPDADTQYRIGSITKTLTAVLVLRRYDRGELDLNERVAAYVPEGPFPDATLRDLLAHRAGVPAEPAGSWWERSRGGSYAELADANAYARPVLPVGERYHYSNTSYAVLGRIVEQQYGCSWQEALRRELLDPLAMARTTYHPESTHADGYSVDALTNTLTPEPHQDTGAMAPAGQLWSTPDDLARLAALLGGDCPELLSASVLTAMATPHSASPEERLSGAYGLGLRIVAPYDRVLIGHTGSMPGFLAGLFIDPDSAVGALVLANAGYGLDVESVPAQLIKTVLEHEPPITAEWEPAAAPPEAYRELLGTWHWGNAPYVMSTDGHELSLDPAGGGSGFRFEPLDADTFRGLSGYQTGETLRVVRCPDGSISHLDIGTFCYTRVPYDPAVPYPGRGDEPPA